MPVIMCYPSFSDPITPMRMIKTADQGMTNGVYVQILGNTASTTDIYSGTNMVNNGLVIKGFGPALVTAKFRFQQANTTNMRGRVYKNGIAAGQEWITSSTSPQFGGDEIFDLVEGDVLTYYAYATSGTSNRRTMYAASDLSGTYLQVVPA